MCRRRLQNQKAHVRSRVCVCVCAAVSVEHLSEVVRHVGLHGLKISASRFKEPRSRGLLEIQIRTLRRSVPGLQTDRRWIKALSRKHLCSTNSSRNNFRFIAAFFIC